jgi:hypothetical protein
LSHRRTAALALAALTSGCSHNLVVEPLNTAKPQSGAIYVLPFTQYTVTMTWRVADCSGPQPKVALKVEAVSGTADDAAQAYVIDPASLQTLTSIGTFNAKWQDGSNALASINAAAVDRSGAIIGNVVTTIAKLAPLTFGMPPVPGRPPPVNAPPPPPPPVCTPAVIAALAASKAAKAQVDVLADQINAVTAEIARLGAKAITMGAALDDATKKALSAQIDRLAALQQKQATASDHLAGALKVITSVRIEVWPLDSAAVAGGPYGVDRAALARWFTGSANYEPPQVALQLERVGSFGQDPSAPLAGSATVTGKRGLRYRVPARGRLVACSTPAPGGPLGSPCSSAAGDIVLSKVEGPVAQLGYVGILEVRNRTFGSTSFSGEFTPLMAPKSVAYEQKAAPAEGATAAMANAASTLAPVFDPTTRVNADTAYLEAVKKRRDATSALQPAADDPNGVAKATLDADTSLLDAQIANARARVTLAELQAKLSP